MSKGIRSSTLGIELEIFSILRRMYAPSTAKTAAWRNETPDTQSLDHGSALDIIYHRERVATSCFKEQEDRS